MPDGYAVGLKTERKDGKFRPLPAFDRIADDATREISEKPVFSGIGFAKRDRVRLAWGNHDPK
jgi:hypothetical protein